MVDPEPSTADEIELPAEAPAFGHQVLEDEQPDEPDPVAEYRDILLRLSGTISFLYEHFDDVVGKAMDPNKAAEVLRKAVCCFEVARDAESDAAKQLAEADRTPSDV